MSLLLIVCLNGSAFPVEAQTVGPISSAVTREAVRLAATDGFIAPQNTRPTDRDWSKVVALTPGTEVTLTLRGSVPKQIYVLKATDAEAIVLDLTDAPMPEATKRVLRDVVLRYPGDFLTPPERGTFRFQSVRVDQDGVFLDDKKVADYADIIHHIPRPQVVEVRKLPDNDHAVSKRALAGMLIGGASGYALGKAMENEPRHFEFIGVATTSYGVGIGAAIGAIVGAVYASHHDTTLIYRAA